MENNFKFRMVRKNGFDPVGVKDVFRDKENRLEELSQSIRLGSETVEKLERELADLRNALQRSNSRPTFADLGSAFEQTLRVAEQQADKLVSDAVADANVIRESARAAAEMLTRTSRTKATEIINKAEAKIEEQRLDVEREISRLSLEADTLVLQAQTLKETASRKEAALIAEVERDAAEERSRLHQELEDIRAELDTLRQIAEREQLRIEREIKLAMEEAEQNRLTRHEEAVELVKQQNLQAMELQQAARLEADNLKEQTDEYLEKTQLDADALLIAARETATNLINRARSRAETLALLFDEHTEKMLVNADSRRDQLERQREAMREFSLELKALASADAMVSIDESASLLD